MTHAAAIMYCASCPDPKGIASLGDDAVFKCSRGHRTPLAEVAVPCEFCGARSELQRDLVFRCLDRHETPLEWMQQT